MSPIDGLKRIAKERSRDSVRDFWRDHKGFIAWIVMAVLVSASTIQAYVAATEAQNGVDAINEERAARVNAQSTINAFFCQQNNHQNAILGRLIAISLEGAPRPITHEQTHELRSVERVEKRLTHPTNCHELALQLAKATGVNPSHVIITPLVGVALEHLGHVGHHRRPADTGDVTGHSAGGGTKEEPHGTPASGGSGTGHSGAGPAGGATHHPHGTHNGGGGNPGQGGGGSSEEPSPPTPPSSNTPEAGQEEEEPNGGGNSNSLKVCALKPLLPKCIEVQL